MDEKSGKKLLQRRLYDLLSHKFGLLLVICSLLLFGASIFQFGEVRALSQPVGFSFLTARDKNRFVHHD